MKYRGCFGGLFVLVKWVPLMVLRTRISLPRNDLRHVRRPGGEGRETPSPTTLRGRSWVPCVTHVGHSRSLPLRPAEGQFAVGPACRAGLVRLGKPDLPRIRPLRTNRPD